MFNLSLSFKITASLSSKSFFSYLPAVTNTQIFCVGEIYKMRRLYIVKAAFCHLPYLTYMQSTLFFPVVKYGCESWTIKKAEH